MRRVREVREVGSLDLWVCCCIYGFCVLRISSRVFSNVGENISIELPSIYDCVLRISIECWEESERISIASERQHQTQHNQIQVYPDRLEYVSTHRLHCEKYSNTNKHQHWNTVTRNTRRKVRAKISHQWYILIVIQTTNHFLPSTEETRVTVVM